MCVQDLLNTQGVNAPVAGSLRVWQPYGDKDKGKRLGTVNRVGENDNPTRSSERKVETKSKPTRDGKPGVRVRGRTTKSEANVDFCVNCQSQ